MDQQQVAVNLSDMLYPCKYNAFWAKMKEREMLFEHRQQFNAVLLALPQRFPPSQPW